MSHSDKISFLIERGYSWSLCGSFLKRKANGIDGWSYQVNAFTLDARTTMDNFGRERDSLTIDWS
jgi:hypothetical protein